jgi:hypothetical protein
MDAPATANILSGQYGPIEIRYRLFVHDINGNNRRVINHHVEGADVSMSNYRDHTWELNIDMAATDDVNPLTDYFTVVADVAVPFQERTYTEGFNLGVDEGWRRLELGTYRIVGQSKRSLESHSMWSLTGESLEMLVAYNGPSQKYDIPAGTGVLAKVKDILNNYPHNVPNSRIAFPQQDVTLKDAITIDPGSGGDGLTYLSVINRLLKSGGFYSLQTDRFGRFVVFEKREDLTEDAPDVRYRDQAGEGFDMMVLGETDEEFDDERFANKVILRSTNVNDKPPIVSVQFNTNPNSPASIDNLGRVVLKRIDREAIKDQATADKIAKQELQNAASFYHQLQVETLPDLRRGPRETYDVELHDRTGNHTVEGRWNVIGWSLPLTNPPSAMSHELSRLEKMT